MAYVSGDGGNDYKVGDTSLESSSSPPMFSVALPFPSRWPSETVFACCGYSEPNGANGRTTTIWQRIS